VTPAEAQAEIRSIAEELLAVEDRLRRVWEAVPRSADEDAMFEGKKAWDLATEIRAVVECVREDLRRVVESLERVSRVKGRISGESAGHRIDDTH
jgi:hypothetical protein